MGASDLFAAGAILFEMLAGRPAFTGGTVVEICTQRCHEQPPALTGSPAVVAVDRVIRRALAKRPADRPASADAMAEELPRRSRPRAAKERRPRADADAARRAAVPRAPARSRDRLPGLQPPRRDRDVALRIRLAHRALERRPPRGSRAIRRTSRRWRRKPTSIAS